MRITDIIRFAKRARKQWGIDPNQRAEFGDCTPVSTRLKRLIEENTDYTVAVKGGQFVCNADDDEEYDHTWLEIEGDGSKFILDATVDQFFSALDVDMVVKVDGIYFSHPNHDGDELKDRYKSILAEVAEVPDNPER